VLALRIESALADFALRIGCKITPWRSTGCPKRNEIRRLLKNLGWASPKGAQACAIGEAEWAIEIDDVVL